MASKDTKNKTSYGFQFEANTSPNAFIRHVLCDITLKTSVTVKPNSVDQRPRWST